MNNIKKIILGVLLGGMVIGVIVGGILPAMRPKKKAEPVVTEQYNEAESFKTGEIEIPELTEKLSSSEFELKKTKYNATMTGDKKTIDVRLDFNGKILMIGPVNSIRQIVSINLENDYDVIKLMITQNDPVDLVKYTYENGAWDREVK